MRTVEYEKRNYIISCSRDKEDTLIVLSRGDEALPLKFKNKDVPALSSVEPKVIERRFRECFNGGFCKRLMDNVKRAREATRPELVKSLLGNAQEDLIGQVTSSLEWDTQKKSAEKELKTAERRSKLANYGGMLTGAVIVGIMAVGNPEPMQYAFNIAGFGCMAGLMAYAADAREKLKKAKEDYKYENELDNFNVSLKNEIQKSYSRDRTQQIKLAVERNNIDRTLPKAKEIENVFSKGLEQKREGGIAL